MKTFIIQWYWLVIMLIVVLLYVGRTTISIKPFRIHMEAPVLLVGIILVSIGTMLISHQIRKDAKNEAYREVIELINEKETESCQ